MIFRIKFKETRELGKTLPREFFKTAQFNTWVEFTYNPTQEGVLKYAHSIIDNGFDPCILIIDKGWCFHSYEYTENLNKKIINLYTISPEWKEKRAENEKHSLPFYR